MPLMRPLYGILKPKVKGHYTQIRHSLKKRLNRESADAGMDMQSSTQKLGSEDGHDWGLRVPGSRTMKTIDLPMTSTHNSDRNDSTSISLSDNKGRGRVFEDWV